MQRQRVDKALIWRLMRFPDEPESESFGTRIGTGRAEFDAINPVGVTRERRGCQSRSGNGG
jgi:hypothetical protein